MKGLLAALLWLAQANPSGLQAGLVAAARTQVGVTVQYNGSYRHIPYPGGDVPLATGVCSDVVIRAYRRVGIDLQVLVHEDMARSWSEYPHLWGLRGPDPNIDHRRVPNLAAFFRRHGVVLSTANDAALYSAGDIVTWRLDGGLPHIGLVSSRKAGERPLAIHNIGDGAREEDVLFAYAITGHFRYPGPAQNGRPTRTGSRSQPRGRPSGAR